MSYELVILKQLAEKPIYANTPRDIAGWLDIDVSRETAISDVASAMTKLIDAGHVEKTREPDELNCDPRMGGAPVDAYRVTESGLQYLAAQLEEASS